MYDDELRSSPYDKELRTSPYDAELRHPGYAEDQPTDFPLHPIEEI